MPIIHWFVIKDIILRIPVYFSTLFSILYSIRCNLVSFIISYQFKIKLGHKSSSIKDMDDVISSNGSINTITGYFSIFTFILVQKIVHLLK